jgi:hypothetical protein
MNASVITFAQLPDEEATFLAYLVKTGDVWARAVIGDPFFEPAPVDEFIATHSNKLTQNATMDLYLGFKSEVLAPARLKERSIDIYGARLVGYQRGGFFPSGELAQSNLYFYRGSFVGDEFVTKPLAFLKWAGKVFGWVRRHTPEQVPVYRCNYKTRATVRVAEAAKGGLNVGY